jgi:hypothetical protein
MTLLQSINNLSLTPIEYTTDVAMDFENASCFQSIKARGAAALQIVVSLLALPIILAIGLLSAAFRVFQGEGKQAILELWGNLKQHVIYAIPTAFVGIFAPLETTCKVAVTQLSSFWKSEIGTLFGPAETEMQQIIKDEFVDGFKEIINDGINKINGESINYSKALKEYKEIPITFDKEKVQVRERMVKKAKSLEDLKRDVAQMTPDQKVHARNVKEAELVDKDEDEQIFERRLLDIAFA